MSYWHTADINECASSPCVNGECEDGIDMFNCACNDGFEGDLCEGKTFNSNIMKVNYFSFLNFC